MERKLLDSELGFLIGEEVGILPGSELCESDVMKELELLGSELGSLLGEKMLLGSKLVVQLGA